MSTSSDDGISIGAVARRTGLPASTLRYWESIGLLPAPQRVGGKRRYDAGALRRIEVIVLAKQVGISLAEIRPLLSDSAEDEPPAELWRRLAVRQLPEIERVLVETRVRKRILEAGLRCECLTFEQCTEQSAAALAS